MNASEKFMPTSDVVNSERIIYTPTVFARSNLIYLQEVGTLNALRIHESKRQGLGSYLFFTVVKGSGTLTVEGSSYPLKAGDCAFIDCRKSYSHRSSRDLWQLEWVHFYGGGMAGIYEKYRERGGGYSFRPTGGTQVFSDIISDIQIAASSQSYIRDMEINEKLTRLLTEIMRNSWNPEKREPSAKRNDLSSVREYLETHYSESVRLDDLAGMFYINKYYLMHLFKEQYGVTVSGYLSALRITAAKKRLRFTDDSLQIIGEECGFSNANYFIRAFKKAEGITPNEFRKNWNS